MRDKLDEGVVKRYCCNPDCPSQSNDQKTGRYLGKSKKGEYAEFLCPECGKRSIFNPRQREEVAIVLDKETEIRYNSCKRE